MLALTKISWPATGMGCARLLRIRRASLPASSALAEARHDDRELVAAQTRHVGGERGLGRPDLVLPVPAAGAEAERHLLKELVAGLVAQRVVDPAEMVEVDEEGRDELAVPPRLLQRLRQPLLIGEPVGQPGQAVVVGQRPDLLQHPRVGQRDGHLIGEAADLHAAPPRARTCRCDRRATSMPTSCRRNRSGNTTTVRGPSRASGLEIARQRVTLDVEQDRGRVHRAGPARPPSEAPRGSGGVLRRSSRTPRRSATFPRRASPALRRRGGTERRRGCGTAGCPRWIRRPWPRGRRDRAPRRSRAPETGGPSSTAMALNDVASSSNSSRLDTETRLPKSRCAMRRVPSRSSTSGTRLRWIWLPLSSSTAMPASRTAQPNNRVKRASGPRTSSSDSLSTSVQVGAAKTSSRSTGQEDDTNGRRRRGRRPGHAVDRAPPR